MEYSQKGFIGLIGLFLVVVVIALASAYFLQGGTLRTSPQNSGRGSLSGIVSISPKGSPQSTILVTSLSTGAHKEVSVGLDGKYLVTLPAGRYIVIENGGTAAAVPKQVTILANQTSVLNFESPQEPQ